MPGRYRSVEEQYFKLRGQFAAGRITGDEFDAALRDLTVTDEHGRVWMLGANSAQWYYYDGSSWLPGDPNAVLGDPDSVLDLEPTPSAPTDSPETSLVAGGGTVHARDLSLRPVIGALVLLAVALLAFAFLLNNNPDGAGLVTFRSGSPTPTRRVPASPLPTDLPTPTTVAVLLPALSPTPPTATPTLLFGPTAVPATPGVPTITLTPSRTPRGQRATPTTTLSAFVGIPSATPLFTPTATPRSFLPPGVEPPPAVATPIEEIPFGTEPTAPPPGPVEPPPNPGLAPDVYVTGLTISPQPGERNSPVTYTATFLNTSGVPRSFAWRVVIRDPNKEGRNQDWGQTVVESILIPPGRSSFSISHVTVTGGGGCIPLVAIPTWEGEGGARIFFQTTSHGVLAVGFDVC